jgi:hypothetical protein
MKSDTSKTFMYWLSGFWSFVTAAYVAAVTFIQIPETNVRIVDTILGFLLGTIVATIINYWMGSSHGSAVKNELIAQPPKPPVKPEPPILFGEINELDETVK